MENNIIKINKTELLSTSEYTKSIQEQNKKIADLRKKQLFNSLKEATRLRVATAQNIEKWVALLSDKLFSPEVLDKMDINKAISLFKYVNNINLRVLADSNRLDEILGKYLQSGMMEVQENLENQKSDRDQLKSEILGRLNQMFKTSLNTNMEDGEVVSIKPKTTETDMENIKNIDTSIGDSLEELETTIEMECEQVQKDLKDVNSDSLEEDEDDMDDIIELDDDF